MATLIATIRRMTGASDAAVVADADITAALEAHRVREVHAPVVWERVIVANVAVYKRARVYGWGVFEPTTQATATANLVTVAQADGVAAVGNWTLDQDGTIVFATDQEPAPELYVSAYTYDLNAACGDVVEQLVGICAADYDVKLGDQTFSRSQGVASLKDAAARFRRKCLPARSGMLLQRLDENASPRRTRRAVGWR